jgi:hypothetical protein
VRLALSAGRAFLVPDTDWAVNGREVRRAIVLRWSAAGIRLRM